jgi:polyisoprenoid-binding protein YceI
MIHTMQTTPRSSDHAREGSAATTEAAMTTAARTPEYIAGTWDIDPAHSSVSFKVRHMMVSMVRGRFAAFSGSIRTGERIAESAVTATIDASSIATGNAQRDAHVRSADFFDIDNHPMWTFRSTEVRAQGDEALVHGDLTIKGVTRPVSLELAISGFHVDGSGAARAGFSATTTINRNDFGVDIAMPLDGGGVIVGDKVQVELDIQGVLRGDQR